MSPDPFAALADLPGVRDAADKARAAVDEVLFQRVLIKREQDVATEARLRGARASALLEGATVSVSDLRSGDAFDDESAGPVARAALRVADETALLTRVWSLAPAQALARLHTVAAADVVPDSAGQPRDDDVVRARLGALLDLLAAPTTAPALVVSAVVHGELRALEVFGTRDGLVARAAARLVLVTRGLDPKAVTVPEAGHARLGKQSYDDALEAYRSATPDGLATWIGHCAAAVEAGAAEGLEVCKAVAST